MSWLKRTRKGGIMKSTSISEILLKKLPYIDVFGQKKRATGWKIENKTQEYYELFFGDHIKNNNPKFYYSLNNEIKLGMEIEKQNEEYAYITTTYLDEKNLRCVGSLILNLKDETCYCNDITDFLLELELLIDIKFNLDYLISELDFYADLGSAYGDVVQKVDEVVEIIRSSTNLKHEQYKNLFSVFLRSWNDLDEEDKEQELMDLGL